ncbi:hypothetical protein LTR86_005836 [Recurvomyces mirabilis]|nr:hypothetical protein LTR86_005836 [Recurvomyces mirabilis]
MLVTSWSILLLVAACEATVNRVDHATRPGLDPDIADTSHASLDAVQFFRKFYTLKSSDSQNIVDCYNATQTEYYDSILGLTAGANRSSLVATLQAIEAQWQETASNDRSYPLRIPVSPQIDAWDDRGNGFISTLPGDPVYPDLGLPGLAE